MATTDTLKTLGITESPVKGVGPATLQDIASKYGRTIAAIKAGNDSDWALADAALAEVAPGMDIARKADYDGLVDALTKAGVAVPTWGHLRQLRQVAAFWPVADRFADVTFSAHKYAKDAGDLATAKKVIQGLLDANGGNPAAVTVTAVRDAVAIEKGNTPPSAKKAKKAGKVTAQSTTVVSGDGTGATDGTAISRTIAQCRALTREILADATDTELSDLQSAINGLNGRLAKVTGDREKATARAEKAPADVTAKKGTKKATKKAKATGGMRG